MQNYLSLPHNDTTILTAISPPVDTLIEPVTVPGGLVSLRTRLPALLLPFSLIGSNQP